VIIITVILGQLSSDITPHHLSYAAFVLNGFEDQERNLTFVKTDFQVSKLKFYACNFQQTSFLLNYMLCDFDNRKILQTSFSFDVWLSNLHV